MALVWLSDGALGGGRAASAEEPARPDMSMIVGVISGILHVLKVG